MRIGANEILLLAAKVTRLGYQTDTLIQLSDLNLEPTIVSRAHLGSDQPRSDFVAGVTVSPNDPNGSGKGASRASLFRSSLSPLSRRTRCRGLAVSLSPLHPQINTTA